MQVLNLSHRNVKILLSKLDRVKAGGKSECTIIKGEEAEVKYPNYKTWRVTAIENCEFVLPEGDYIDSAYLSRSVLQRLLTHGTYTSESKGTVIAIPDEEYYSHRLPGEMHPEDEEKIRKVVGEV